MRSLLAVLLALALAACAGTGPPAGGPAPDAAAEGGGGEAGAPREREGPESAARPRGGEARPRPEVPPAGARAPTLPAIPARRGPLEIRVTYPDPHQRIAATDSNFLFGTVGSGDAELRIDGVSVPVEPNGAFLAWLPLPRRMRGDTAVYRLVAWRDRAAEREGDPPGAVARDTQRLELPVLLPRVAPPAGHVGPWIDTVGLGRSPERWVRPGEPVALTLTGGGGLRVWVEAGGQRIDFEEQPLAGTDSLSRYRAFPDAESLRRAACGGRAAPGRCRAHRRPLGVSPAPSGRLVRPASEAVAAVPGREGPTLRVDSLRLPLRATPVRPAEPAASAEAPLREALRGPRGPSPSADTLRAELALTLAVLEPDEPLEVALEEAPDPVHGRAGVVVGRPTPGGPYRWRFPDGTRARVTARRGDRLRILLQDGLEAWVAEEDVRWVRSSPPGAVGVYDARVEPRADRLAVRIGLERPVPVDVRQTGPRRLSVLLHGAAGETGRAAHGSDDPLLEGLGWEQRPGPTVAWSVELAEPVWGWRVGYERGDARAYEGPRGSVGPAPEGEAVLLLEIRRPPPIDPAHPLRGRRVAVDPGHPPGGSRGPTGYFEGDANLAIALRLAELLEEEGATPVLVRRDDSAAGLYERTRRAVEADAEMFVSIHANALPDGVRPFGREGTSTYYHHRHARDLARAVQAGMLAEMGLRDLGIVWADLAVARLSWIPSVLAEGAFMMHPAHEAALRTAAFQERYARGVLRGLEAFLRGRAAPRVRSAP